MTSLFEPLQLGNLQLPNRVIMAPLTRCRASTGRVPNDLMAEYYRQRASAGLIITEATSVDPMGVGYPDLPLRIKGNFALNEQKPEMFYGGKSEGYTDYPEIDGSESNSDN